MSTTSPAVTSSEVRDLEAQIDTLKKKLSEARGRATPEVVAGLL